MKASFIGALAFLFVATAAHADELRLKDGSKIIGTIVGFEDSSFKVQTSYGFAVVRKDQVVSIVVSTAEKKPEAEKKPDPEKKSPAPAAESKPAPKEPPKVVAKQPEPAPAPASMKLGAASSAPSAPPAAAPKPAPAPPPAAHEPIREEVSGNTYTNETYGFRMYKPPAWQIIEGARQILPGTITALGTSDGNTYLLIGQEPLGRKLESHVTATEGRLSQVLENYRPLGEKHITIAGVPAVERRFRGSVDDRDWSGIAVFVPRGDRVFTIFGMTYAASDLVQIQENIITRTISSLEFDK